MDRDSGKSKGFGFVTFETEEEASKAKDALHDQELDGRRIRVDFSRPREDGGSRYHDRGDYGRRDNYDRGDRDSRDSYNRRDDRRDDHRDDRHYGGKDDY